jgi:hypothetical protein
LTREAQLIFRGTVERPGGANLKAIQPGDDTAVVRIDEVLQAPDSLGKVTGREVTVKLRAPRSVQAGEQAVFFTKGWLYGESLGLVEVGHFPAKTAAGSGMLRQVALTRQRMREEEVRAHLAKAAVVVAGRVVATRRLPDEPGLTEHDPQWSEAVIQVDAVLKGAAGRQVRLLYPASRDIVWFSAPKPQVGWDGIWLLEKGDAEEIGLQTDALTALRPWNIMSRDDAALVERLVKP